MNSASSSATSTTTDRSVASAMPSNTSRAALRKRNLSIALGSVFGILALILIFGLLWFFYLPRRRKRMSEAWTIDGPSSAGHSPATNGMGNGHGQPPSNWAASGGHPAGQTYGYPMEQATDGTWQNGRYGYVGNQPPPPVTALQPAPAQQPPQQQAYYGHPQDPNQNGYYDPNASTRAPNRYVPGFTLSTITEKSTPQMGAHSPPLPNSPSIGANTPASFRTEELGGYYTAPTSEDAGGGGKAVAGEARDARTPYYGVQPKNETGGTPNAPQPQSTKGKSSSSWI